MLKADSAEREEICACKTAAAAAALFAFKFADRSCTESSPSLFEVGFVHKSRGVSSPSEAEAEGVNRGAPDVFNVPLLELQ